MNRFSRDASAATDSAPSYAANPFGSSRTTSTEGSLDGATFETGSPEQARRLLDEVQQLGTRMRLNRRKAQQIDRRAAAYASRLARHTARLLQHMPNAIPAVRPVPGTGASTLRHYVLRHDQLDSPDRSRLLVVSSDGRLRVCTVLSDGKRSRLWNDYEVANPPVGLGLLVVFEGLSSMIVQLESAVTQAEAVAESGSNALDGMIAQSEAKLANAGSRLSPVDDLVADEDDLYGQDQEKGLRSHGFEHRLPVSNVKPAPATSAPGRFAR
ncbi:MAG: hypothetical protein ABI120_25855 [Gemmatimonadaceae bacterium]